MLSNYLHTGKIFAYIVLMLGGLLVFPSYGLAQLTIVDYGLCRVEGQSKQAMVGDSPEGVLSADEISIIEKTNMISATKGTCFGVLFSAPLEDSENLGLEARIYHPAITLKNGRIKEATELPLFIFTDKPSFVGWRFKSSNELVSGDWVVEFSNDTKILARQRFMVQATPTGTDDMVEEQPVSAPIPMDRPDHPIETAPVQPKAAYEVSGEWETITRYLVQVAAHSKHDNMIAYEQKLKGMGLSPFSFVEPCNCSYKNLYLTFVDISNSREAAAEHARRVTETYGINTYVHSIEAVVPAGWPQD